MALSCKSNGGGKVVAEDVTVYTGKIEDVGILNGVTPEGWEKPIEVGLKLFLEKGGLSFQPELMVYGSVKRDGAGNVEDWGGAFPVRDVINQIAGYDGPIGENLELPVPALKQLVGKPVYYIRYKSNRAKSDGSGAFYFGTFREVGATEEAVIEKWKKSRNKGYPKDYFHAEQNTMTTATATAGTVF